MPKVKKNSTPTNNTAANLGFEEHRREIGELSGCAQEFNYTARQFRKMSLAMRGANEQSAHRASFVELGAL